MSMSTSFHVTLFLLFFFFLLLCFSPSVLSAVFYTPASMRTKVEHVTLRLGEGKSCLIGGLARVEVVYGRPFMLTFFVSNEVRLHPTATDR